MNPFVSAHTMRSLKSDREKLVEAIERIDKFLGWAEEAGLQQKILNGKKPSSQLQYDWERGRKLYEARAQTTEIAKALGCSPSGVKHRRITEKWVRKTMERDADAIAKLKAELKSEKDNSVAVVCPNCDGETYKDPCEHCRNKLPTTAAIKLRI